MEQKGFLEQQIILYSTVVMDTFVKAHKEGAYHKLWILVNNNIFKLAYLL